MLIAHKNNLQHLLFMQQFVRSGRLLPVASQFLSNSLHHSLVSCVILIFRQYAKYNRQCGNSRFDSKIKRCYKSYLLYGEHKFTRAMQEKRKGYIN